MAKFLITLESGEDGYFVASRPALPGCHSQSVSREEVIQLYSE